MVSFKIFLCLLAAVSTALADGWANRHACYDSGMIFSQMHDEHGNPGIITDAIIDFCVNEMPQGDWKVGQVASHCYPFPKDNSHNRVNLEIKNEGYTKMSLATEECVYALRQLYNDCWCGGKNNFNGFLFRIDPNAGRC